MHRLIMDMPLMISASIGAGLPERPLQFQPI